MLSEDITARSGLRETLVIKKVMRKMGDQPITSNIIITIIHFPNFM